MQKRMVQNLLSLWLSAWYLILKLYSTIAYSYWSCCYTKGNSISTFHIGSSFFPGEQSNISAIIVSNLILINSLGTSWGLQGQLSSNIDGTRWGRGRDELTCLCHSQESQGPRTFFATRSTFQRTFHCNHELPRWWFRHSALRGDGVVDCWNGCSTATRGADDQDSTIDPFLFLSLTTYWRSPRCKW
jgi:hypothetical protein